MFKIRHLGQTPFASRFPLSLRPYHRSTGRRLTLPEGLPLVLVQPLDSDGLKSDPGGRVILKHLPHVLLAEAEQVRVAQRADGSGTPVARGPHVQPAQKSTRITIIVSTRISASCTESLCTGYQ